MNLSELKLGKAAIIPHTESPDLLLSRLIDTGLCDTLPVICLFKSLSGGIRAYRIGSTTVAIRQEDARHIICSEVPL